jgi:undecaprenyl-diphosphatase
MSFFQSIVLGVIQGLTEFLPISSSAHLVIAPYLFGWKIPADEAFVFDVLVQVGTLVAVIVYFWKDLVAIIGAVLSGLARGKPFATPNARLGWNIVLATIPAGVIGFLLQKDVEAAFNSVRVTAILLLVTAALLTIGELVGRRSRNIASIDWKDSLWIGFSQAISIFPGISRSGSTMTGGMTRHLDRPSAARFAFLMAVPVMLAAGLLAGLDLRKITGWTSFLPVILAGFATAAVVGYFAIRWLLRYLTRNSFYVFAIYTALLGAVVLILSYV